MNVWPIGSDLYDDPVAGASIHFFGLGTRVRKIAKSQNRDIENCVCLVVFSVKFNGFVVSDSAFYTYSCITYYEFFKLSKLLRGKTICLPPPPPPPQDRRLCPVGISRMSEHNQLQNRIILRTELCSYNLSLSPLQAGASSAVDWREQTF